MKNVVSLCSVLVAASIGLSCQLRGLHTYMTDEVPPRFTFKGGPSDHVTHLTFFLVKEVSPENQKSQRPDKEPKENKIIWWVWPNTSADSKVNDLPVITYGKIPPGFTQKVPERGDPPKLEEGKVYDVGGPEVMVPCTIIRFTVRDGKAVKIPIPGREDSDDCKSY